MLPYLLISLTCMICLMLPYLLISLYFLHVLNYVKNPTLYLNLTISTKPVLSLYEYAQPTFPIY